MGFVNVQQHLLNARVSIVRVGYNHYLSSQGGSYNNVPEPIRLRQSGLTSPEGKRWKSSILESETTGAARFGPDDEQVTPFATIVCPALFPPCALAHILTVGQRMSTSFPFPCARQCQRESVSVAAAMVALEGPRTSSPHCAPITIVAIVPWEKDS